MKVGFRIQLPKYLTMFDLMRVLFLCKHANRIEKSDDREDAGLISSVEPSHDLCVNLKRSHVSLLEIDIL